MACYTVTRLVMVRRYHKDNRPIARDVVGAAWANLSKEDVGDNAPEEERNLVCQTRSEGQGVMARLRHGRPV
jgi:hypothetical protein